MKKLIALAVASAFIAPAAFADSSNVTIGGNINTAVVFGQHDDGKSFIEMKQNNDSELNFSGSEDLGNGSTAYWRVGNAVNVDGEGPTGFANRDTYIGVKGSWGDLRLGRGGNDAWPIVWGHPFRYVDGSNPHYTALAWNLFGPEYNFASSDGSNQITYLSPDMNGFSFALSTGSIDHVKADGKKTTVVASVKYNAGSWNISAAYQDHGNASWVAPARVFMLGGGFNVGSVSVGIQAASAKKKGDAKGYTNFGVVLSGSLSDKMSWMAKASHESNKQTAIKGNVLSLGLAYALGKRTEVGLEFSSRKDTGKKSATQFAIGLNQNF